jgi:hypothetical protein
MTPLHIPLPCSADFNAMPADGRGRRCGTCSTVVVDLVGIPALEERALLSELLREVDAGRRVCVHARTDAAGVLQPPPRHRRLLTNGLAGLMAMAIAGCQGSGPAIAPATTPTASATADPVAITSAQPTAASAPATAATISSAGAATPASAAPAGAPSAATVVPLAAAPTPVPMVQVRTTGMLARPPAAASAPASGAAPASAAPADTPPQEPVSPQLDR